MVLIVSYQHTNYIIHTTYFFSIEVDSYNKFLEDISTHGEKLLRKRYLQEVSEENLTMSLVEVDVSDCCFGQALRYMKVVM